MTTTALPSDDAVTAYRREMKFCFRGGDERRLRDLLELRCETIRFGEESDESRVSSIYFDDDAISSCAESLAGIPERTKLRLRWYDEPLASTRAIFEVKRRTGTMVRKLRTPIQLNEPLEHTSYPKLMKQLAGVLPDGQAAALALRSRPTALVSYRRRHYRDPGTGMRLTIDYDIVGFDQLGRARPNRRFPVHVADLVVLEAKAGPRDILSVSRLVPGMRARLTRSSKYVTCCARMGWCNLSDRHE
jgi:hypothetical protein